MFLIFQHYVYFPSRLFVRKGWDDPSTLYHDLLRKGMFLLRSEWLLFNAKWEQFFSYIMARTSYIQWNDDDVRFVLDQHAELDFYSASSLNQQSASRHVAPIGHIFWFRVNQSVFFLLNVACLAEKQQIHILYSLVWPDRDSNPHSTALKASTLTNTPLMRF